MKKILIVLSTIFCMFALGACGEAAPAQSLTDETAVMLGQEAQALIEKIVVLSDQDLLAQMAYFSEDGQEPNTAFYNGLSSWKNSKNELGAYTSAEAPIVTKNAEGAYVITINAAFANRKAIVTVMTDKKVSAWEIIKFDAVYSFGEKMQKAAMNTLMGMGTVFIVLVIMIACISCFSFIPKIQAKFEKKSNQTEIEIPMSEPTAVVEEEEDVTDDLELVAVITAAIAAAEETSTDGLVVRSIRRVGTSKWKRA